MLKSLYVENYKGFKKARIDFKPITLFLGENSAGKSSIIELLLMLQETAMAATGEYDTEKGPLTLESYWRHDGRSQSVDSLFHNKEKRSSLTISIKYTNESIKNKLLELFRQYNDDLWEIANLLGLEQLLINNKEGGILGNIFEAESDNNVDINQIYDFIDEVTERIDKNDFIFNGSLISKDDFIIGENRPNMDELKAMYKILRKLNDLILNNDDHNDYIVQFNLKWNKDIGLYISGICIDKLWYCLYSISPKGFMSDLIIDEDTTQSSIMSNKFVLSGFDRKSNIFTCIEYNKSQDVVGKVFSTIARNILEGLRAEFDKYALNHVSPIHTLNDTVFLPKLKDKNGYIFDGTPNLTTDIEDVLKKYPGAKVFVNNILRKFNIIIDVEDRSYIVVNQDHKQLSLREVGFGISQILPILLHCYVASTFLTTMIEQPEVHLHPKMQAELANIFVDITKDGNKILIIESHSEYMLRRLRRLMSDPKEHLSPKDVSIQYFRRLDSKIYRSNLAVKELEISDTGDFEWPEELYMTGFEDNIEFLKNQKGDKNQKGGE